jgi:hypothetical protein
MTKSQYGITNAGSVAAAYVKSISMQHSFFKNNVNCTVKKRLAGALDEVVIRTIMTMYYIDKWKRETVDVYKFVGENATEVQFEHLEENLNILSMFVDESVTDLFTTTNTPVWLAVYDKFLSTDLDTNYFIDFMRYFKNILKQEKLEPDFEEKIKIYKTKATKDKNPVIRKITMLTKLMSEYLQVSIKDENLNELNVQEFIEKVVDLNVTEEDVNKYEEDLEILTLYVDNTSKLLDDYNRPVLLAIVAYSYKNDIFLDKWFTDYFERNETYLLDKRKNFLRMVNDLEEFLKEEIA